MNQTENDVRVFIQANQSVLPIDRYLKWMKDNGAVRVKGNEIFVVPDKQSSMDELEIGGRTFLRFKFFRDLWSSYCSSEAKKEFRIKMTEVPQDEPSKSIPSTNTPEYQEIKKEMDESFNDIIQHALDRF